MPFVPHNRLQVLGDFYDGVDSIEEWSFNLNFGGDLAVGVGAQPSHNGAIAAALTDWWSNATRGYKSFLSAKCRMYGFKWNRIDADGTYTTPEQPNTYYFNTPLVGNATTPFCPPQVACAVSLRTGKSGRSFNGRIFLPMDGVQPTGQYAISSAALQWVPVGIARLLEDVGDIAGPVTTGQCVVASSKGFNTKVTEVRVGNRFDTQRRRRRSLYETYTVAEPVY